MHCSYGVWIKYLEAKKIDRKIDTAYTRLKQDVAEINGAERQFKQNPLSSPERVRVTVNKGPTTYLLRLRDYAYACESNGVKVNWDNLPTPPGPDYKSVIAVVREESEDWKFAQ